MPFWDFAQAQPRHPAPGVTLRPLWGEKMMLVRVELAPHAEVPRHSHPHEQGGIVLEGEFDLTIGQETRHVRTGDSYLVPGNVEHGVVTGPTPAVALDIFSPPREDYMR